MDSISWIIIPTEILFVWSRLLWALYLRSSVNLYSKKFCHSIISFVIFLFEKNIALQQKENPFSLYKDCNFYFFTCKSRIHSVFLFPLQFFSIPLDFLLIYGFNRFFFLSVWIISILIKRVERKLFFFFYSKMIFLFSISISILDHHQSNLEINQHSFKRY